MTADEYDNEVRAISILFGVNADKVSAELTGDEDASEVTPFQFVEQWVDRLDRDNVRAQEDAQHTESEIREIYREHQL